MTVNPTPSSRPRWLLVVLAALVAAAALPAFALDFPSSDRPASDSSGFETFSQWSIVPLSGARLEGQASLAARQEFKFSTVPTGRYSYGVFTTGDLGPSALHLDNTVGLDQVRATYRYTWLSMRDLDLKVGLTSNLSQLGPSLGSGFGSLMRFGNLPLMHVSGVGRLSNNWRVALDANGMWTARGRSLDLGLHVDYSLSRSMQLFGGYQMTDLAGDAEDPLAIGTVNTANFGLRYRF